MRVRAEGERLWVEHLPTFEWVRAGLLALVGLVGLATFGPSLSGPPVMAVMLPVLVSVVMVLGAAWLAWRSRGDRVLFDGSAMKVALRKVGLQPERPPREFPLHAIEAVEVAVANVASGGARWLPCLRIAGEEVPLLGGWLEDRGECERAATEIRRWLAAHGAPAAARAAAEESDDGSAGNGAGKSTTKRRHRNRDKRKRNARW